MKKVLLGIIFSMLLIIPVLSISCEAKELVYISGRGCNGFSAYNELFPHRLGLLFPLTFIIKSRPSGNTLSLTYTDGPIILIKNGTPPRIIEPSAIKIGLTEPKTFGIIKFFFYDILTEKQGIGTRVFALCDSLDIEPL
jgi:hypothetical protein